MRAAHFKIKVENCLYFVSGYYTMKIKRTNKKSLVFFLLSKNQELVLNYLMSKKKCLKVLICPVEKFSKKIQISNYSPRKCDVFSHLYFKKHQN